MIVSLIFIGSTIYAQKKVTGPEAKNYKIWQSRRTPTKILFSNNYKAKLSSPEFKNFKAWKLENIKPATLLIIGDKKRHSLKGPKRKNYKVWEK